MKKINFKLTKVLFRVVLILPLYFAPLNVNADTQKEKNSFSTIELVDNTKGIVVISDQEYRMRLGMKVIDSKNRILNRYALKVGQNVKFSQSFDKQTHYIDSIVIIRK